MSAESIHFWGQPKKHDHANLLNVLPNQHHAKLELNWLTTPITKISKTTPPTTYSDVKCTNETSESARLLLAYVDFRHDTANERLYIRQNGVTSGGLYGDGAFMISTPNELAYHRIGLIVIPLDEDQIFEYKVDEYTDCRIVIVIFGYMD